VTSYQAKIDLLVSGTNQLNKLKKDIDALQAKIDKINNRKIVDVGARNSIKDQVESLKEVSRETKENTKNTEKQLVRQIRLNGAVRLYKRRLEELNAISVRGKEGDQIGKAEDRKALEELANAFTVFKNKGSVEGVQSVSTELGRIVEANRTIERQEFERLDSSEKIKNIGSQINKFKEQGLDVSKAQSKFDEASILAGTNKSKANRKNLIGLHRELNVLKSQSKELEKQARAKNKQRGSAIIGGAFPLLFGQGPGAAVGGAIGGNIGEKMGIGGFAGSLAGTTIGNALDTSVQKAAELGNALNAATQNMQGLRDAGVEVTTQAQLQVEAALKLGDTVKAQEIATTAVAQQTGDLSGSLARLASGSLSELQKAWNGILNAVSTTVGVLAAPFINALAGVLRIAQGIFVAFNALVSAIEKIIRLVPGFSAITDQLKKQALVTSEAYQQRQVELTKEAQALEKNLAIQTFSIAIAQKSIGLTSQQNKLLKFQADRFKLIAANSKKVEEARVKLGSARTPGEEKRQAKIIENVQKEGKNKLKLLDLSIEKTLFDTRVANNKSIASFNTNTSKQYKELETSAQRKIADQRLKAERAIEDARLKASSASLATETRLTQLVQQRRSIATEIVNTYRSLGASLSSDPQASIEAELANATDKYKNAILKTQEDRALSEQKIALDLKKATIQVERLKKDNALAIARLNLDNSKKVAEINEKITDKRRAVLTFELGVKKFGIEAGIQTQIGNLNAENAGRRQNLFSNQFWAMGDEADPQIGINNTMIEELEDVVTRLNASFAKIVSGMPKLTSVMSGLEDVSQVPDFFGGVANQQQQTNDFIEGLQDKLAGETAITEQQKAAAAFRNSALGSLAQQQERLSSIGQQLEQQVKFEQTYNEQIKNGVNPALAEQLTTTRLIGDQTISNIDAIIRSMEGIQGFEEDIKNLLDLRGTVENRIVGIQAQQIQQFKGPLQQFIKSSTDQLRDLESVAVSVSQGIGNAIGGSLASGISGLIEGSATVKDVFADMLKSIGQTLVQEGTKMIATYIAIGIAKAFAGMGRSGGGGVGKLPENPLDSFKAAGVQGPIYDFQTGLANGGPAKGGQPYMVGERGPELFVPGQSGGVMRNEDMRSLMGRSPASGGAASMNFSFETTSIGGTEYVSREQLESAMAVTRKQASNDGAKRGMSMTLDKMQNSPRTRSKIGLR